MKDKNAVLIGFVSSAIDYLKSQDNRDIAELLEENELDDIKGDLTAKLNSLLFNANADSDYLVNAGKEAFSDFVVDKKKTLVDEFAELFDDKGDKEKDIVDRLEELLTNNDNDEPDLSELFPGLLLDAPEDEDEATKKLFNNVLKEVETESYGTDELDEVFSEIIAHENGLSESIDVADLFEDEPIISDNLIEELVSDDKTLINDDELAEKLAEVHISDFIIPTVKKNDKSDSEIFEQISECADNIASEVDSEREYYGVSAPVMWVEPKKEVHMSSFTVPSIKKNDKSDDVVYAQVCECALNIADVVNAEREFYGVSAPVMWVEPKKEDRMSDFIIPTVKKNDKSDSEIFEQISECADNIASEVDSEREYYGVSAPTMWVAPVKEIRMSPFTVPAVKKNDKSDSAIYAQVCECALNIADVVDSEREYYGVSAPTMWVEPKKEVHMSSFIVPSIKKNDKSDDVVYAQVCECALNIADVVDAEREFYGVSAPTVWVAPVKEIHMSPFTVPAVKKNDKSDSEIFEQISECADNIASEVDSEREYYGVSAPTMWVAPVKEIHMSDFVIPSIKKNDKSEAAVYAQVCECALNIADVVDAEREFYGVSAPVMWVAPVKEEKSAYTWISNPGLDYLEDELGSNDKSVDTVSVTETVEKTVEPEKIETEDSDEISLNKLMEDLSEIESYLNDFEKESKKDVDLNDYLNDLVDELESTIKIPKIDQVYISIAELYPYLSQDFIHVVYDLKNVVASEYSFGKSMILLHRLSFKEIDGLRSFVEIALDHGYQVNADEDKMIVDVFKEYVNSDGLILTAIFEIANQAAVFAGEYEGYRVIPVDQEV